VPACSPAMPEVCESWESAVPPLPPSQISRCAGTGTADDDDDDMVSLLDAREGQMAGAVTCASRGVVPLCDDGLPPSGAAGDEDG
jgi:hypothetical protein